MHPNDFTPLDVARFRLSLCAQESASLPHFLGSTLRGAFGHALKQAVCVMRDRDCSKCYLAEHCIYPYLFETPAPRDIPQLRGQQQVPHPFILSPPDPFKRWGIRSSQDEQARLTVNGCETPNVIASGETRQLANHSCHKVILASGDEIVFDLMLVGKAIEHLPYVVYTVSEMAKLGLGATRARFELNRVEVINGVGAARTIFTQNSNRIDTDLPRETLAELIDKRLNQLDNNDLVKLQFLTPTRIRVSGDLQAELNFTLLVRNILRRVSLLTSVHGSKQLELDYRSIIALSSQVSTRSAKLRWWDLERYSNRQKMRMKIGGFIGEIEYEGDVIKEFLPLLVAGELLRIGAGTSFGLGKYQVLK